MSFWGFKVLIPKSVFSRKLSKRERGFKWVDFKRFSGVFGVCVGIFRVYITIRVRSLGNNVCKTYISVPCQGRHKMSRLV